MDVRFSLDFIGPLLVSCTTFIAAVSCSLFSVKEMIQAKMCVYDMFTHDSSQIILRIMILT